MRWMKHERVDRVQTARDEGYRLRQLCAMVTAESTALGRRPARSVTEDDIESAFDVLRQRGYAASTINHYVQTVKSLEQWAVRKGHLLRPWLTTGTSVRRKKHAQRNRRLHPDVVNAKDVVTEPGEEKRLLEAANPWMQRLIIAALDTGCPAGRTAGPSVGRRQPRQRRAHHPRGEREDEAPPGASDFTAVARSAGPDADGPGREGAAAARLRLRQRDWRTGG
jgi:hypothetical protein